MHIRNYITCNLHFKITGYIKIKTLEASISVLLLCTYLAYINILIQEVRLQLCLK